MLDVLPPLPWGPWNRGLFSFLLKKMPMFFIFFFFFLLYNKLKCNLHLT